MGKNNDTLNKTNKKETFIYVGGERGIFKTFSYHFLLKKSALLLKSPLPPPRRSCWKDDFDDGGGDDDDGDERFCWSTPRFDDDDAIKIRFAKVVFVVVEMEHHHRLQRRRSHHPMRFERDRKSFEHHDERS